MRTRVTSIRPPAGSPARAQACTQTFNTTFAHMHAHPLLENYKTLLQKPVTTAIYAIWAELAT